MFSPLFCLFVNRITQKLLKGFPRNFDKKDETRTKRDSLKFGADAELFVHFRETWCLSTFVLVWCVLGLINIVLPPSLT